MRLDLIIAASIACSPILVIGRNTPQVVLVDKPEPIKPIDLKEICLKFHPEPLNPLVLDEKPKRHFNRFGQKNSQNFY